jgi:hypothetical protein
VRVRLGFACGAVTCPHSERNIETRCTLSPPNPNEHPEAFNASSNSPNHEVIILIVFYVYNLLGYILSI